MNTSRRNFLKNCAAVCSVALISKTALKAAEGIPKPADLGFPLVDFHVHLDNSTIEKVMEIARQRNVQFGIVEHAGTKENVYPVVLSSDDDLKKYMANLSDKPVFKGVQAEWIDWMAKALYPVAQARFWIIFR